MEQFTDVRVVWMLLSDVRMVSMGAVIMWVSRQISAIYSSIKIGLF